MTGETQGQPLIHDYTGGHGIQFYRQPGGCIEIWQTDPGASPSDNDCIHVCGDDELHQLVADLQAFADRTRHAPGVTPPEGASGG